MNLFNVFIFGCLFMLVCFFDLFCLVCLAWCGNLQDLGGAFGMGAVGGQLR